MVRAGERLREERERKGLTLDEVAKATKIKPSFLLAIEKGEYQKLPLGTYAHGFVGNYAKFLKLPEHEIMAIFKREYNEEKYLKIIPDGLAKKEDFPLHKFRFTTALKIFPLIFIALLVYLVFQYKSAIFNPPLSVSYPLENSVISSQTITVTGKTDPNVTVSINSQTAALDKDGNFRKTINVFPGKTKIIIKSVNSFKKTTILERHIEIKI
jgi:cytoskeletal protein RodZ